MEASTGTDYAVSPQDPEKSADLSPKVSVGKGEAVVLKHADPSDGDEALRAFAGHDGEVFVMTPEMEKKLLRKIDLNLMPVRRHALDHIHCLSA